MTAPVITREQADQELARRSAERDAISAGLVELDTHPVRNLVPSAGLTGVTATRWAAAQATMGRLWQQFNAYQSALDAASAVRARRSRPGPEELAELTALLRGRSVEVSRRTVPLEQRSLTGPAEEVERATLTELVAAMTADFPEVARVLARLDDAWSDALPRLDVLDGRTRGLTEQGARLGVGAPEQISTLAEAIGLVNRARDRVLNDPLGLTDELESAAAAVGEAERELARLAAVRDGLVTTVTRLRGQLDEVARVEQAARQAARTVAAEILDPALPRLPDSASRLRRRLDALGPPAGADAGSGADGIRAIADEVARLDHELHAGLAAATAARTACTQLLDRRTELSGRLDGYRAKAAGLGLAADAELTGLYRRGRALLNAVPCDLRAATSATHTYQQAVLARTERSAPNPPAAGGRPAPGGPGGGPPRRTDARPGHPETGPAGSPARRNR
jgi:VIT1/CCC1 family predicted Fe2+/Mn2+ transporter